MRGFILHYMFPHKGVKWRLLITDLIFIFIFWLCTWTIPGVLAFFVLLGFFGLILHCSSLNSNDPHMAGCQNCCYGWGILDCFPASMEACFALVIVFVVIFAILGVAYGFLAATMAIQRIWQRHYHILTKRELTKVSFQGTFLLITVVISCKNDTNFRTVIILIWLHESCGKFAVHQILFWWWEGLEENGEHVYFLHQGSQSPFDFKPNGDYKWSR